jgi:beta-glucanase (GH16 family)
MIHFHRPLIAALSALTLLCTVVPAAAQGGLVAAYGFNEGSGATTADATGNGNTGTISGATWNASGRFGGALSFNGTSNWVTVPDSASLDLTTGMTVGAWVRPTATNGARVVLMKERTTAGLSYSLGLSNGVAASYIRTATDVSASGGSGPLNTWTHIAATYDGATLRVYVNAVQAASLAVTGAITTSTSPLRIGGDAPWGQYFSGLIDEVRIYNRALTPGEILTDMNTAVGGAAPSPDFSISATPSSRSLTQGGSTTYTVTVGSLNGFAGAVSLGVSGQPAGTTVSFSPGSITGSGNATLTVTTSGATPTGSSTLTITGTSGALSHSTTVGLSVASASVPDFTIGVSPSTRTVTRGSSTTYTVTIGAVNGFAGTVTFGTSGVPSNTTASFSPPSVTGSGTTTLTVSTTGTTPTGGFTVTVTGTSGALSHGASAGLTVTAPSGGGPSVISINFVGTETSMGAAESAGVVPAANWNNAAGSSRSTPLALVNQTGAATGASVTWSAAATRSLGIADTAGNARMMRGLLSTNGASVTTVSVSGLTAAWYDVYVYADGDNGSDARTAAYSISGPGISTASVSVTDAANATFNGSFTRAQNSTGNYARFTVFGGSFTISAEATGSGVKRAPLNGLQVAPASPDFVLSATPASRTVTPGSSTTYNVTVSAIAGFSGSVALSATGLPSGASASFNPSPVTGSGSSVMTVVTQASTPIGSQNLTISGVSGALTRTASVGLVVGLPSTDPMPIGPAGPWTLTFQDEFDGSALNTDVWDTKYADGSRTNNDELEWYVDDDRVHVVSGGTLKLVALDESSHGGYPYTSGMISSQNSFNQMYGYFEARMKLPAGQGFWPAFWLLPVPFTWPPEIDIMESLGDDCSTIYMSNHWSSNYPSGVGEPEGGADTLGYTGANYCSGFHTYGVEWTPTTLDFYIDGVRRARITGHVPVENASFTGMYIVANLAVGGSWPGPPNASTPFPSALEIDYIRVWRR